MHNQADTNTNKEDQSNINCELTTIERFVIAIDQPMSLGTFLVKNVINATITAFTTAAVFKGLEYLKDRKERKEQELSVIQGGRASGYSVAGEQ